jgi:hypothetical protein
LLSFAVLTDPQVGWNNVSLELLPSHRVAYLDYEGPISRSRGEVKRVAIGSVRWLTSSAEDIHFELVDMEFLEPSSVPWPTGRYCLTCTNQPSYSPTPWRLVREQESE